MKTMCSHTCCVTIRTTDGESVDAGRWETRLRLTESIAEIARKRRKIKREKCERIRRGNSAETGERLQGNGEGKPIQNRRETVTQCLSSIALPVFHCFQFFFFRTFLNLSWSLTFHFVIYFFTSVAVFGGDFVVNCPFLPLFSFVSLSHFLLSFV